MKVKKLKFKKARSIFPWIGATYKAEINGLTGFNKKLAHYLIGRDKDTNIWKLSIWYGNRGFPIENGSSTLMEAKEKVQQHFENIILSNCEEWR